jgi:hypothetical protein
MTRSVRRALFWTSVVVASMTLADGLGWVSHAVALAAGSVAVAVVLLSGGVSALASLTGITGPADGGRPAEATPFDEAAVRPTPPAVVPDVVEQAERLALLARATAGDVHFRLRPVLRDIAAELLADRLAIDLDVDRDGRAEAVLGPDLWDIVRPGRPAPENRQGPGVSAEQLEALVDRLEAVR